MNVAIFGGTFDPVHLGHLAVARAAQRRYALDRIHFVPAQVPPHKRGQPITSFQHRYAMVQRATAGERRWVASRAEEATEVSYSIATVRRFARKLKRGDRLFFLIGIDAFLDIAKWREPVEVLRAAEVVVASRPGFPLARVIAALPAELRAAAEKRRGGREVAFPGGRLHVLAGVRSRVSATAVRAAAAQGRPLGKLVPRAVAEYIEKKHLYRRTVSQED
jgi:nicotinate-nucleotide adenylyltransferase